MTKDDLALLDPRDLSRLIHYLPGSTGKLRRCAKYMVRAAFRAAILQEKADRLLDKIHGYKESLASQVWLGWEDADVQLAHKRAQLAPPKKGKK